MCRIHIFLQGSTLYFIYWYIISILSLSQTLPYSVNDVRRRSKFSIRSSPSTCVSCPLFIRRSPFLIRRMRSLSGEVRSVRRKVLCMLQTWNGLHRTKASAGCTVAMRWHAFCSELVCSLSCTLSSSRPFMSGGPDSRPDYYLTCNGSTGGVPDIYSLFSGQLLTRNAWKLMNNGCKTVVHGTKLITYTWQNFQLHRL